MGKQSLPIQIPAFDQKGLDWARNVGFGSWL